MTIADIARVALANNCKPLYSPRRSRPRSGVGLLSRESDAALCERRRRDHGEVGPFEDLGEASASGVVVVNDQDLLTHVWTPDGNGRAPIARVNCLMRREIARFTASLLRLHFRERDFNRRILPSDQALDGTARRRIHLAGIRPARNASRPRLTASFIASAIATGSCAPAIAVFIRTPSAPEFHRQ